MSDLSVALLLIAGFVAVLAVGMAVMDFLMGPDPDLEDEAP